MKGQDDAETAGKPDNKHCSGPIPTILPSAFHHQQTAGCPIVLILQPPAVILSDEEEKRPQRFSHREGSRRPSREVQADPGAACPSLGTASFHRCNTITAPELPSLSLLFVGVLHAGICLAAANALLCPFASSGYAARCAADTGRIRRMTWRGGLSKEVVSVSCVQKNADPKV